MRILKGYVLLYLIYLVARFMRLKLLTTLLNPLMGLSALSVIVLFQYEIRKLLSLVGSVFVLNSKRLRLRPPWVGSRYKPVLDITAIVEATKILGSSNTGALVVLSNNADLKFYVETGDLVDGLVSKRLLEAILHKGSPLHDGAVIIYQGRIVAARCILPVTEQRKLSAQFGIRHRAALGMSEITDTLVLVVSEETGQVSVAREGILNNNLSAQELRTAINDYLHTH